MLARIAHQLFWVGRYVSRAERAARMLDGAFQSSVQGRERSAAPTRSLAELMAAMGAEPGADTSDGAGGMVWALTLDRKSPASVTWCIDNAREGARRVRDVITREMWEALNTAYLELHRSDIASALRTGPHTLYSYVRERCALFWGISEQTMLRDPSFAFLAAGRHLEAASMMLRVLTVSLAAAPETEVEPEKATDSQALGLLQAVGGVEAFRRSVAGPAARVEVARFLLMEPRFPDSVSSSMQLLSSRLADADEGHSTSAPALRLSRIRAELEFHRVSGGSNGEAGGLTDLCRRISEELNLVNEEIERRYFADASEPGRVVA